MAQAATTNINITPSDGWQKVATDPLACSVHSNGPGRVQLAITIADSEPTVTGEMHPDGLDWQCGTLTGYVWVKAVDSKIEIAVTLET